MDACKAVQSNNEANSVKKGRGINPKVAARMKRKAEKRIALNQKPLKTLYVASMHALLFSCLR